MKISFEYGDFYANISVILDTAARNSITQQPLLCILCTYICRCANFSSTKRKLWQLSTAVFTKNRTVAISRSKLGVFNWAWQRVKVLPRP